MKYLVTACRILVGFLFIVSGLIKLNDPMGFSFKLEEYFSIGVLNLPSLEPYALAISLFVVIAEVQPAQNSIVTFSSHYGQQEVDRQHLA